MSEKILEEAGFKFIEGEWVKGDWTIRLIHNMIEVFNKITSKEPRYFFGSEEKLKEIIEAINTSA